MLKPKVFFSQVYFGVDYRPPEVTDSFSSHSHLWLAHPNSVPASKRFVEWRNDCPEPPHPPPQTLRTAIKNSKAKTVFLTFFPPPDIWKQNKTSKQTERFNLDLWDQHEGDSWSWGSSGGWQSLHQVPEKGCLRIFLSSEAAIADSLPKPWNVVAWLRTSWLLTILWIQNIFI